MRVARPVVIESEQTYQLETVVARSIPSLTPR